MKKKRLFLKLFSIVSFMLEFVLCFQQSQACKRLIDEDIPKQQAKRPKLMTSLQVSASYPHYGNFDQLPEDLLFHRILPQCNNTIIQINRSFFTLVTGYSYQQIFDQGFESKPVRPVCTIISYAGIDFKNNLYDIQQVSSFLWYSLLRYVMHIPSQYWPYLKGTQIQVINLNNNQIKNRDMRNFGQSLQGTQVQSIDLDENDIGDEGMRAFGQCLQGTELQFISLAENEIGDKGVRAFGQYLQGTQIQKVDLSRNQINDNGARDFGQSLQGTQVRTLDLSANFISSDMEKTLREMLPSIKLKCEDYDYD